jgi:uncharacterized membrane protein YeaQ/YmgE (transglycosylase-associated protein family)
MFFRHAHARNHVFLRRIQADGAASLMGWIGLIFLGAVIGAAGWWLHPLRRATGRTGAMSRIWTAIVAGVLATVVARMLGNIIDIYHDGDTLEWFACAGFALVVVTVVVALTARR